jgi:hypothetical protein
MEIPGFTAEASLNNNARYDRLVALPAASGRYSRIGKRHTASLDSGIVPATCCMMRCTHPESAPWAWECDCTWECPE